MKIYLKKKHYQWLVKLKIIQAYAVPDSGNDIEEVTRASDIQSQNLKGQKVSKKKNKLVEVCYNDQIYLQNGFFIGKLLKVLIEGPSSGGSDKHENDWERIVLPRHFVKTIEQNLQRIRQIAVLKANQNWEIISQILEIIGYKSQEGSQSDYDEKEMAPQQTNVPNQSQIQSQIGSIVEFLYEEHGPISKSKKGKNGQKHYSYIDPYKFSNVLATSSSHSHPFQNVHNLLEFTCMLIFESFSKLQFLPLASIDQCFGLLIENGKYMKQVIITVNKDTVQDAVIRLYKNLTLHMGIFEQLLDEEEEGTLNMFMAIFLSGTSSSSEAVAQKTCHFIEQFNYSQQWFAQNCFNSLIVSQHGCCINLAIKKSIEYQSTSLSFDPSVLQRVFQYEEDYYQFLIRFLPLISKSHFKKEILEVFTLQSALKELLKVFQEEEIQIDDDRQYHKRSLARQGITCAFQCLFSKVKDSQKFRCTIAFDNLCAMLKNGLINQDNASASFSETINLLSNLFSILRIFLIQQDSAVQKYFKVLAKYMKGQSAFGKEINQFIIANLKSLYVSLPKAFPLGWLLESLFDSSENEQKIIFNIGMPNSTNKATHHKRSTCRKGNLSAEQEVNHLIDFELIRYISQDSSLLEDEVLILFVNCLYLYFQVHGDCYLETISNLVIQNNESTKSFQFFGKYLHNLVVQLLNKILEIKLPRLSSPTASGNPLSEQTIKTTDTQSKRNGKQMTRVEAFGIKKKEILIFQELHKYKELLLLLGKIQEPEFLKHYERQVSNCVKEVSKDKDLLKEKKAIVEFFKEKLLIKIKTTRQIHPKAVDLVGKSIKFGMSKPNQSQHSKMSSYFGSEVQAMEQAESRYIALDVHHDFQRVEEKKDPNDYENFSEKSDINEFLAERKFKQNQNLVQGISHQQLKDLQRDNELQQSKMKKLASVLVEVQLNTKESDQLDEILIKPFSEVSYEKGLRTHHEGEKVFKWVQNEELQNFELSYIKGIKEQNKTLFQLCGGILIEVEMEIMQTVDSVEDLTPLDKKQLIKEFLKRIKIWKYMPEESLTSQLWEEAFLRFKSQRDSERSPETFGGSTFVAQVLVQSAFLMFGFSTKISRVRIKILESLVSLLKQSLKQRLTEMNEQAISSLPSQKITKTIEMEHKLAFNRISSSFNKRSNPKIEDFSVCFQVLNNILEGLSLNGKTFKSKDGDGIGLVEPLSLIIMSSLQVHKEQEVESATEVKPLTIEEQEVQLLEKILQDEEIQRQTGEKSAQSRDRQEGPSGIVRTYKKSATKKKQSKRKPLNPPPVLVPLPKQVSSNDKSSQAKQSSRLLRQKLSKRKKQLMEEIKFESTSKKATPLEPLKEEVKIDAQDKKSTLEGDGNI